MLLKRILKLYIFTMHLQAQALIVTCIDYRIQEYINTWISENFEPRTFDRVAFGGGVLNLDVIMTQVKKAKDLHNIQEVVLINHEECGAYGAQSTPKKHAEDLKNAKAKINEQYPNLKVKSFYLHLNGQFEKIN